jgi:outer membrane protein TolC
MLFQYLTAQKLAAQIANLESSAKRGAELLRLTEMKRQIGAGIPLEIARARSLVELDRIKKLQLQTKYSKALGDLAILLGRDTLGEELDTLTFDEIKPVTVKGVLARAPEERSDLRSARSAVVAANRLSADSQSVFFPKFTLISEVGSTRASLLGLPPERATGFLGFKLEIPLETGGFLGAKRQEASALAMRAEAQERQTRLELQNQMKEASEQIQAATEAVRAAEAYVRSANDEAALADRKFRVGTGGVTDVLSAHNSAVSARDTEIEALFAFESAKIALFKTTGGFDGYFK